MCFSTPSFTFLMRISPGGCVKMDCPRRWRYPADADAGPSAFPSAFNKGICSYSALGPSIQLRRKLINVSIYSIITTLMPINSFISKISYCSWIQLSNRINNSIGKFKLFIQFIFIHTLGIVKYLQVDC